jgi:hypothetical protein
MISSCATVPVPANPGVNPSLSMTAMTKNAMSYVRSKNGGTVPRVVTTDHASMTA